MHRFLAAPMRRRTSHSSAAALGSASAAAASMLGLSRVCVPPHAAPREVCSSSRCFSHRASDVRVMSTHPRRASTVTPLFRLRMPFASSRLFSSGTSSDSSGATNSSDASHAAAVSSTTTTQQDTPATTSLSKADEPSAAQLRARLARVEAQLAMLSVEEAERAEAPKRPARSAEDVLTDEATCKLARLVAENPERWIPRLLQDTRLNETQRALVVEVQRELEPLQDESARVYARRGPLAHVAAEVWRAAQLLKPAAVTPAKASVSNSVLADAPEPSDLDAREVLSANERNSRAIDDDEHEQDEDEDENEDEVDAEELEVLVQEAELIDAAAEAPTPGEVATFWEADEEDGPKEAETTQSKTVPALNGGQQSQPFSAALRAQFSEGELDSFSPEDLRLFLSMERKRLMGMLQKRMAAGAESSGDASSAGDAPPASAGADGGAAAAGGNGSGNSKPPSDVPPPSDALTAPTSSSLAAAAPSEVVPSSSASPSLSESDWGLEEFRPQLFTTHSRPASFSSRSSPSSASVPRVKDVLFLGLSSKFTQLPGQPFSVSLPESLLQALSTQKLANQLAAKGSANVRPRRMFLGLFFREEKNSSSGNKAIAASQKDSGKDASSSAASSADSDHAKELTSLQRALLVKEAASLSEREAASSSSSAPASDSLAANGEEADADVNAPHSVLLNRSALRGPTPGRGADVLSSSSSAELLVAEAQVSGFEPTGVLAEVVDFLDNRYVLVLCHRRISMVKEVSSVSHGAAGSVVASTHPHVRVNVQHHDDPTWAQLQPPSLRYDPELLRLKDECLRLLRAIRAAEGEQRFRMRTKPYFSFSTQSPGAIVDYWSTLCTSASQQIGTIASATEQKVMSLGRSVLMRRELLPRMQAVYELLQYEYELVQAQQSIEVHAQKKLSEDHFAMLSQQKKEVEQSIAKINAEAALAKAGAANALAPPQVKPATAEKKDGGATPDATASDGGDQKASADADATQKSQEHQQKDQSPPDTRTEKEKLVDRFAQAMKSLVGVPPEGLQAMEDELEKLRGMDSESSFEYSTTRNYLDWLTSLPWGRVTPESFHVRRAEEVLAKEHYGLEEVKSRILEFVATGKMLNRVPQGKIICLVGPPGVGKTSIGKSIAHALGRQFFRVAVGGLSDVAEIKGHRRTYVGSMPGKLLQALRRVQCANPVILIDEVDKLGRGHRGDPAAALLEVLDPEQNNSFADHYLDVPVDLSKVLFIATANERHLIPAPLADRMDFLELSGYLASEKVEIATNFLEPAIRARTGVTEEQLQIRADALFHLIRWYCREAGVRSLQKYLERIYRKVALVMARKMQKEKREATGSEATSAATSDVAVDAAATSDASAAAIADTASSSVPASEPAAAALPTSLPASGPLIITPDNLKTYAGSPNYLTDKLYEVNPVGVSTGLAYSAHGGAVLFIESAIADVTSRPTPLDAALGRAMGSEEDEHDRRSPAKEDEREDIDEDDEGEPAHSRPNPAHTHSPSRGDLFCTGQMGSVMKESSSIAYTVAKRVLHQRTQASSPRRHFFDHHRIHLHLPHGATPKDGPSAGIAMVTALISLALDTAPLAAHAMTGELTLTGKVLPIGGVKEKLMSATHAGIRTVVLPADNAQDVAELKPYIIEGMTIHYAHTYDDVFKIIFPHWTETSGSKSVPILGSSTLPSAAAATAQLPAAAAGL